MQSLCDVNCLLAFCYDMHIHHLVSQSWIQKQDELSVIVCRNTQMGLLRLLTNSTVMGADVCSLTRAWNVYDLMMKDDRFDFHAEPVDIEQVFRKFTNSDRISPRLWQDAYLSAFAIAARIHLVTFDGGFKQYDGLRLTLLS